MLPHVILSLVTGRIRKDCCSKMDFALRESQGGGRSGTWCFVYLLPSWASLLVQTVKNLPVMQETRVWSLDQEDPWRRTWQPTPVFLPGEFHGQRSLAGYSPWGYKELGQNWHSLAHSFTALIIPWALSAHPFQHFHLGISDRSFHHLHDFAFSCMSNCWNSTVCCLFRLPSFT